MTTNCVINVDKVPLGLYRIFWKSGGSSLASVGMTRDGGRWIAPTNWTHPSEDQEAWKDVDRIELIEERE